MYESGTWRVRPGETLIFGRARTCSIALPAGDRGLSRSAGSFRYHDGAWWLHNDSRSALMYVTGDRGFRVDLPPGMQIPLQQWHAKVQLNGLLDNYTLRLRWPDLDDLPDLPELSVRQAEGAQPEGRRPVSTAHYRAPLNAGDRLVLAARAAHERRVDGVADPALEIARRFLVRLALGDLPLVAGAAVAVLVPDLGDHGHMYRVIEPAWRWGCKDARR
jgi:hypothetical protein